MVIPCENCGHKTILASGTVTEFTADQEPYENGIIEECDFCEIFSGHIVYVNIHYCPVCHHINDDVSVEIN